MIHEKTQRLADLAEQLPQAHMTATICADEIRAIVQTELDSQTAVGWGRPQDAKHRIPPPQRPLVNSSTFSMRWAENPCSLRRTILFRLAERLARQPNQYITADQLLRDVWNGGAKSPDTIRSAVRHLRRRLSCAGMQDLVAARATAVSAVLHHVTQSMRQTLLTEQWSPGGDLEQDGFLQFTCR